MGESFQDYSWIQDFEADHPKKVSLNILLLWFILKASKVYWPFKNEIANIL